MKSAVSRALAAIVAVSAAAPVWAQDVDNPYVGRWALTIPGGGAGWLGVTQEDGYLDAAILWGGGSVLPVSSVYMDGGTLVVTRSHSVDGETRRGKP